ncbi:monocarboxylate transporter 2-like [Branchiostoma floridae x Branchiostoma belcheri]
MIVLASLVLFQTGLGYALTLSSATAIVGQYFTKRRAMANSLTVVGASVASMSFPPLFQYLMDEFGWKGALLIIGGMMLNMIVAGALIRPLEAYRDRKVENGPGESRMNDSETVLEPGIAKKCCAAAANFLKRFWAQMDFKVILIPSVALFLASLFMMQFCLLVPGLYIVPRAKQLQIEDYAAASLLSVSSVADMVSRLAVGAIPDNSRFSRFDQYGLSLCLLGITNLLFPLAKTYPALVAYAIAHGAFYGAFIPTSLTCLAELVGPKRLPSAIGILMSIQGFASLAGPPFAGWLFDETQSYDATFLQAGAGFLLAGLLPFLLRLRKKRPADTTEEPVDSPQTVKGENETLLSLERETAV